MRVGLLAKGRPLAAPAMRQAGLGRIPTAASVWQSPERKTRIIVRTLSKFPFQSSQPLVSVLRRSRWRRRHQL